MKKLILIPLLLFAIGCSDFSRSFKTEPPPGYKICETKEGGRYTFLYPDNHADNFKWGLP